MGFRYRYQNWRREGTRSAVHGLALRAIKPWVPYRSLYGMELSVDRATVPEHPSGSLPYESRFLSDSESLRFSEQEPALRPKFTREALARGDRCYAILDDGRLASFGWYATQPVVVAFGLYLHFDPGFAYMHTGFTHTDYRGQRLHAIGMGKALRALADEGSRGLLSCVDTDNLPSLRSCARMGYRRFGVIRVLGKGERAWSHNTAGCAAYGFVLSTSPDGAALRARLDTKAA